MHQICKLLDAENVSSPYKYGIEKGYFKENNTKNYHLTWMPAHVKHILSRQQYCGDMVQNVMESTFLETGIKGSYRYNDKENWIIVENTHEAIITREDYAKVQKKLWSNIEKKRMQLKMNKQIHFLYYQGKNLVTKNAYNL